ncbi:MAG TPA: hypothetical protein VFS13_01135 [Steroidobacteraceae bacterium]|nr:hypothetical protein [Steroidobacteraceae bacterium]
MSARAKLLLLFVVCAAPLVLGWAAWYFRIGIGTSGNYGELIEPRPLDAPAFKALRGKWVMVSVDSSACDAYCEKKLYFMRQIRKAQGEDQRRIERLWIVTDAGAPAPRLLEAYEGTHIATIADPPLPGAVRDHLYLVDPLGNLMMRFPRDPDASRMIKDLQRLMKYSSVG